MASCLWSHAVNLQSKYLPKSLSNSELANSQKGILKHIKKDKLHFPTVIIKKKKKKE